MKQTMRKWSLVAGFFFLLVAGALWLWVSRGAVGVHGSTELETDGGELILGSLAPDGSRVLLLNRLYSAGTDVLRLDEYRARQRKSSRSIVISTSKDRDETNWQTAASLRFCDHGRFLLVYVGNGSFAILDAVSLKTLHRLDADGQVKSGLAFAASCAAEAPVAVIYYGGIAVEDYSGIALGAGHLAVFDLESGRKVKNIEGEIRPDHPQSVDVAPSGARAIVLFLSLTRDVPPRPTSDLTVFDLHEGSLSAHLQTGMTGEQAVFVGEGEVAVGSGTIRGASINTAVHLFRLDTGEEARSLCVSAGVAGAPIAASADGRFLMSYTGREEMKQDHLHIGEARFTIWNTSTATVAAQSSPLYVSTVSAEGWDLLGLGPKESIRPVIAYSQGGGLVLVTHPGYAGPVETYAVSP